MCYISNFSKKKSTKSRESAKFLFSTSFWIFYVPQAMDQNSKSTLQMIRRVRQSRNFQSRTYSSGVSWVTHSTTRHTLQIETELQTIAVDTFDYNHLEYIGRRGIGLSGSYQQGYSTAYNTRSHIKVVCNGYILVHILNWNTRGHRRAIPPREGSPPCMIRGHGPICMLVKRTRVSVTTFWHGFWLRGVQPLSDRW